MAKGKMQEEIECVVSKRRVMDKRERVFGLKRKEG